jgi:DNA-binding XRE family transcriptional regulator
MQSGKREFKVQQDAFGGRLRELRLRVDRTQEAVAKEAGIALATYNKAETGKGNPRLDVICRLAPALEVEVEELFKYNHHIGKKRRSRSSVKPANDSDNTSADGTWGALTSDTTLELPKPESTS